MYLFVHHDVIFHKRHFFPISIQETLQKRRGFQRTAEIDTLCGIHQLDSKDLLQIIHHFIKFSRGIGAHTYVVFLSIRRDNGIA